MVNYIFAFWAVGWISRGLDIWKSYWGKLKVDSINSTMQLGWIKVGLHWAGVDWGGFRLDYSVIKVYLGKIKCSFHKPNHVIGVD